ncbi:MAG: hypothetical protein DRM99_04855, partial [Thermoplasmata archaeon]
MLPGAPLFGQQEVKKKKEEVKGPALFEPTGGAAEMIPGGVEEEIATVALIPEMETSPYAKEIVMEDIIPQKKKKIRKKSDLSNLILGKNKCYTDEYEDKVPGCFYDFRGKKCNEDNVKIAECDLRTIPVPVVSGEIDKPKFARYKAINLASRIQLHMNKAMNYYSRAINLF